MKNRFVSIFLWALLIVSTLGAEPTKMNFVFILVDDLGKQDMSCEGSTFYETPNIDALARSGMRFSNGYSTCQVCSPSRASIMLGTYPARNKITDWIGAATGKNWRRNDRVLPVEYVHALPKEETTIAEAMRAGGYRTFFAGKWHLGGEGSFPEDHGFDINIGGHHRGGPPGGYFSPYRNPKMKDGPKGESLPIRLAKETADFIEANKEQKFFAYLSFYSVHGPIQTAQPLWQKYQKKAAALGLAEARFKFDRTKGVRQVQDNPIYAGMMESLDNAVGIVLKKLRDLGLDKNTVVIFTSDNGGVSSGDAFATACLPFRGGKGRQWEGGIRQPYYIHWPGMTKGSVTQVPANATDFYPTILEIAGLSLLPERHLDGVSLAPVLRGGEILDRPLFWHYPHYGNQGGEPSAIMLEDDWKLIHYFEDGRNELYRLADDIGEQTDVAAEHTERVAKMAAALTNWQKEVGASYPTKNPKYDDEKYRASMETLKNVGVPRRNRQHAAFLNADYKPNGGWWDQR